MVFSDKLNRMSYIQEFVIQYCISKCCSSINISLQTLMNVQREILVNIIVLTMTGPSPVAAGRVMNWMIMDLNVTVSELSIEI